MKRENKKRKCTKTFIVRTVCLSIIYSQTKNVNNVSISKACWTLQLHIRNKERKKMPIDMHFIQFSSQLKNVRMVANHHSRSIIIFFSLRQFAVSRCKNSHNHKLICYRNSCSRNRAKEKNKKKQPAPSSTVKFKIIYD